jgi:predicted RNA binding protein YcfA (HicA-like mRNA interferase family)
VKVRDVIKRLEADGWYLARILGDYRHYKHPTKKGIVTVSGHPGKDMPVGTLLCVLKQAHIEKED